MTALVLPPPLQGWIEAAARSFLQPPDAPRVDFSRPAGEEALVPPASVSWRVFKNPVAFFAGGVAAVVLELAEPRVRAGVWERTSFRTDPVRRLQRTGLAAMVTVYGPRSAAEGMIAAVNRAHAAIAGRTPAGLPYRADDPELLRWVQATASYGFARAYSRYVRPLSREELDRFYAEGAPAARLYGASGAPTSAADMRALLAATRPRLEPSPVIPEFLRIVRDAPAFPGPLRPAQRLLVRAAPPRIRPRPGPSELGKAAGPLHGRLGRPARAPRRPRRAVLPPPRLARAPPVPRLSGSAGRRPVTPSRLADLRAPEVDRRLGRGLRGNTVP